MNLIDLISLPTEELAAKFKHFFEQTENELKAEEYYFQRFYSNETLKAMDNALKEHLKKEKFKTND